MPNGADLPHSWAVNSNELLRIVYCDMKEETADYGKSL